MYRKDLGLNPIIFKVCSLYFLFYLLSVVLTKNNNCENILSIRKENTKFDEYVSFQDQIDNDYFIGKIKINDETINYNYKLKDFERLTHNLIL